MLDKLMGDRYDIEDYSYHAKAKQRLRVARIRYPCSKETWPCNHLAPDFFRRSPNLRMCDRKRKKAIDLISSRISLFPNNHLKHKVYHFLEWSCVLSLLCFCTMGFPVNFTTAAVNINLTKFQPASPLPCISDQPEECNHKKCQV